MTTRADTTLLRLRYLRAKRAADEAKRLEYAAWWDYLKHMRSAGFCASCEKPLGDCKCVIG